jgi:hypothetical protein
VKSEELRVKSEELNMGAFGFSIPPVIPLKRYSRVGSPEENVISQQTDSTGLCQCPLSLKVPGSEDFWLLPLDPVVGVSGKNVITRRNVLKQGDVKKHRGTIKELWSQDDYRITVAGMFQGENAYDELLQLRNICEERSVVEVENDILQEFNITRMVIESFEYPHTKGSDNFMWTLQCYSDDEYEILVVEE